MVKNRSDLIRFNPRRQSEWIRTNPNQSELGLIQTQFSIRINPNHSDLGFIRIDSDWKLGLDQSELRLIRIENLVLDWFGSLNELQNVFRIGSEWFTLARIEISEWIGIVLIGSEWIPIRYFRLGFHIRFTTEIVLVI